MVQCYYITYREVFQSSHTTEESDLCRIRKRVYEAERKELFTMINESRTELTVGVGGKDLRIFLHSGFNVATTPLTHVHNHQYAELHLVADGEIELCVNNENVTVSDATAILIPKGKFHYTKRADSGVKHFAMQIDHPVANVKIQRLNKTIVEELFCEIGKCSASNNYRLVSAFIGLVCSYLLTDCASNSRTITDPNFLIHEFFSNRYSEDLHLSDLARVLHLSERQAERLVVEITGRTFREQLSATRINMAHHLIETGGMPLSEIASHVGYRSYTGFWKAMHKDDNKQKTD